MIKNVMFSYNKFMLRSTKLFWRSFGDDRNYVLETIHKNFDEKIVDAKDTKFSGNSSNEVKISREKRKINYDITTDLNNTNQTMSTHSDFLLVNVDDNRGLQRNTLI